MNILILGATGFIGSALTLHLSQQGHKVTALAHKLTPTINSSINFVEGDIHNKELLKRLLYDISHVIYTAGATTPGTSQTEPTLEVLKNLLPLTCLLEVLQGKNNIPTIIYLSSAGAFCDETLPKEDQKLTIAKLSSYYSAGKASAESFIKTYTQQNNSSAIILRPTNAYGPGQQAKPRFGIIPTIMQASIENKTFSVWGDGSLIKDFIYIKDLVKVFDKLLLLNQSSISFKTYNLASQQNISINQLIHTIEKITQIKLKIVHEKQRKYDRPQSTISIKKTYQDLTWLPSIPLEVGLKETWQWFLEQYKK